MVKLQKNNLRYERKYVFNRTYLENIISNIYSSGLTNIYSIRKINNIYFDDYGFSSVKDNVEGICNRNKSRIRWYGKKFGSSLKFYEQKIKDEFVGWKKIKKLENIKFSSFDDIECKSKKLLDKIYPNNLIPTLYNSYKREYFIDQKNEIRITVDNDLFFYSPLTKNIFFENKVIVEIKYSKNKLFLNNFKNFNLSKYSKYVKGITQTSFYMPIYN